MIGSSIKRKSNWSIMDNLENEEKIPDAIIEKRALDDVPDHLPPMYPYQQDVFDMIIRRFENGTQQTAQLLPAATGWGKTIETMYVIRYLWKKYKIKPFLVVPATLRLMWGKYLKNEGIECYGPYSYQHMTGTVGKVISGKGTADEIRGPARIGHKWLCRGNGSDGPFYATEEFREICSLRTFKKKHRNGEVETITEGGLLMIFDESQALKNRTSAAHWACFELISSALCFENSRVRLLHLTAALFDTAKCRESFFRIMGFITEKEMLKYNIGLGFMEWKKLGLGTCYDMCSAMNPQLTRQIFSRHNIKAAELPDLFEDLWDNMLRGEFSLPVTDPIYTDMRGLPFIHYRQNGFYLLDDESAAACGDAIYRLKRAHVIKDNGDVDMVEANSQMALIQSALMSLAHAKTPAVLRVCIQDLREHKTCKVVLCIPFREDQDWLFNKLKIYNPLLLHGGVRFEDRETVIDNFNSPNLKHRVLIMTPQVGGVGISLHDQKIPTAEDMKSICSLFPEIKTPEQALFPRRMHLVPTFHFLAMFQACGRIYRAGMRSDVFISFFYGSNAPLESILVNTMIKSNVAGKIAQEGTGRLFPNEYDFWIEDEGEEHQALREILTKLQKSSAGDIAKDKKTY